MGKGTGWPRIPQGYLWYSLGVRHWHASGEAGEGGKWEEEPMLLDNRCGKLQTCDSFSRVHSNDLKKIPIFTTTSDET